MRLIIFITQYYPSKTRVFPVKPTGLGNTHKTQIFANPGRKDDHTYMNGQMERRKVTIRINHNRSTALERSVMNYWGLIFRTTLSLL